VQDGGGRSRQDEIMRNILRLGTALAAGFLCAAPVSAQTYVEPPDTTKCRYISTQAEIDGVVRPIFGQACLQPDGSWQFVGDGMWVAQDEGYPYYYQPWPGYWWGGPVLVGGSFFFFDRFHHFHRFHDFDHGRFRDFDHFHHFDHDRAFGFRPHPGLHTGFGAHNFGGAAGPGGMSGGRGMSGGGGGMRGMSGGGMRHR
jgi:surface antigen